jgi:quinol monooxygenase YgiN
MPFVQLIEFQTDRIEELNTVTDEWLKESADWRTATRAQLGEDRDRPGTYIQVVEFPSYEAAMENSNRPATARFAAQIAALCDGPAIFRNIDVSRIEEM